MKFEKIFEAFPTPKFLNFPYAGISISDTFVRCIQFAKNDKGLFVEKYSERPVPAGVVQSGQITNPNELGLILETLKKDLGLGFVKVSLPEEKAYLFTAKIPIVAPKDVRGAIEFKMEENVPVSPAELIFDYMVTENYGDHLDVVVSALPVALVDSYVDVLNSVGLSPLSLEIESQAVARAILPKGSIGTVLLVHFGVEKVGLYVASNGIVRFTSTVQTHSETGDYSDFLSKEIKKLFTYWKALKDNVDKEERKIKEIIVCGENFSEEIVPFVSVHNKIPVTMGNVWVNAFDINTVIPEIPFKESLKYTSAVGLSLPSPVLI